MDNFDLFPCLIYISQNCHSSENRWLPYPMRFPRPMVPGHLPNPSPVNRRSRRDGRGRAGEEDPPSPSQTRTGIACLPGRSEEHTSELQSRENLVCRLPLEKKEASI